MRALALATLLVASNLEAAPVRRHALIFAHPLGGPQEAQLHYAEADADKLATVLVELGGFASENVVLLKSPDPAQVLGALSTIEAKIVRDLADGTEPTLLVYYSGHAKNGALLLGTQQLPMRALKDQLLRSGAKVRIGILDACESGAITREKGGRRGPSFLEDAGDVGGQTGVVLIGSSSADESSQESDELGGSFFTHHLVSGLRGDADVSGDRKVTLSEVYTYAYHRTVRATANTRAGPQHPTYSYDLEGQGEVILTDLATSTAALIFEAASAGDFLVFDDTHDRVAAELSKKSGEARRLALPPGRYWLKQRFTDHLAVGRFEIQSGELSANTVSLKPVPFSADPTRKGGVATVVTPVESSLRALLSVGGPLSAPARAELFPTVTSVGLGAELGPLFQGRIQLEVLIGGRQDLALNLAGVALPFSYFQLETAAALTWQFSLGPFEWALGPRLATLYTLRTFSADALPGPKRQDYFGMMPGAVTRLSLPLGDWSIEVGARAGLLPFGVDDNRLLFFGAGTVAVGYRL